MIVESSAEVVTPDMAAKWLQENCYVLQRKLKEPHVERLAAAMCRGDFGMTVIRFGERGDRRYLIDGQHRLSAVVRSGRPTLFWILCQRFDTDDAMAQEYAVIDGGVVRTTNDVLHVLEVPEKMSLPTSYISRAMGAISLIGNNFNRTGALSPASIAAGMDSKAVRVDMLLKRWQTAAYAYYKSGAGAERYLGFRLVGSPVIAVGMATFQYQPEQALSFWEGVANNDGLRKHEPQHTLHKLLMNESINSKGASWYTRAVAGCWNAYYENRTLSFIRADVAAPIKINGTPWNGREVDSVRLVQIS